MEPKNPSYRERVMALVEEPPFMRNLGTRFVDARPGYCETVLTVTDAHLQQDGYVHAGVQGALADHTSGCAAFTLVAADDIILTAEYKVNLLRPGVGERLRCRATVLRAGRTLMVTEADVLAERDGEERLVARVTATMAVTTAR